MKSLVDLPDYAGMLESIARVQALQDAAEICLNRSETMKQGMRKLEAEACAIAIFQTARGLADERAVEVMWSRKLILLVETGDPGPSEVPMRDEIDSARGAD